MAERVGFVPDQRAAGELIAPEDQPIAKTERSEGLAERVGFELWQSANSLDF
jgi:hypothetical protein